MSKFKIFDGTNWIDPCDCNVNIRTIYSTWQKLDPANCPTYYWSGTQWCPIVCECKCADGFTLNSASNTCTQTLFSTPTYSQDYYTIVPGGQSTQYSNLDAILYSNISTLFTLPIIGYRDGLNYVLYDTSAPAPGLQLLESAPVNDIIYKGTNASTGFLNTKGIWASQSSTLYPNNQTMTLSYCVNPTENRTYVVAIAGTGEMTIKIDPGTGPVTYIDLTGATSASGPNSTGVFDLYAAARMFPILVPAGSYTFYFEINNYGFLNPSFAVELYELNSITEFIDIVLNSPINQTALDAVTIFSTKQLLDTTSIIADPLDSPGTFTCPTNYSLSTECFGTPTCVQFNEYPCGGEPSPPPVITSRTEINIWFDNSGSMGSTLTPLNTMRDTLLQACLLPVYNNDLSLYNQRVKVLNFSDNPSGYERFIHLLATDKNFNRTADATVDQVINLTFADESDSYGYGNSFPFDNTQRNGNLNCPASPYCGTYDTDIANLRSVLATTTTLIKGCAFRVNTGPDSYPGFRGLTEATFVNTGVYAVPYNVSDYVGTNFSYQLDVVAGSTPAYYLAEVVSGLNSLGFVLTC